ncbi:MAG: OmpA family protein [Geminicoccaceae bacterium]
MIENGPGVGLVIRDASFGHPVRISQVVREEEAVIMRIFGIILCLLALGLTGYSALVYKAPVIEADIQKRSVEVVSALAGDDGRVDVQVDGRQVTLVGHVADEEQRQRLLHAAAGVAGARGPIDGLDYLTVASPYQFSAVKKEGGEVTVQGMAPTSELSAAIETDALAIFGDEAEIEIDVAAGVPEGDWRAATGAALDALATMRQGELSIKDADVTLKGNVADQSGIDAINIFADALPDGFAWTQDVTLFQDKVEPFTFSVVKDREGGLTLAGFAPDEKTRDALIEQGKAASGDQPVVAEIQIAGGMPDEEWPSLVMAGITAMKDMQSGRFDVVDNDVSFASDPDRPGNAERSETASAADDEEAFNATEAGRQSIALPTVAATDGAEAADPASDQIDVAAKAEDITSPEIVGSVDAAVSPDGDPSASPPSALTIDKVEQGVWSIRGTVPDDQAKEVLLAEVRIHAGVAEVETELEIVGGDPDDDWLSFATDHVRTLNQVRAGRLDLEAFEAHLIGVVDTPENIEPINQALTTIAPDMTVDLQPIDPRPAASLDLSLSVEDGVLLNGALPEGLTEGEALLALGIRRYDGRLDENGRGRASAWREDLSKLGAVLPAFEELKLSLDNELSWIKGRTHAHGDAEDLTKYLVLALGDDRRPLIDIETTTVSYDEGARRTNPMTGKDEIHRLGYWLPAIEIAADETTCRERSSVMLVAEKITFRRGEEDLDDRDQAILNQLAGLAIACLDDTGLSLEIGGHTDSRGAQRMNQELSKARADAVLAALTARGVEAKALIAVGYGDEQPVADNATDEGRAANRRITFEWKPTSDLPASQGEG